MEDIWLWLLEAFVVLNHSGLPVTISSATVPCTAQEGITVTSLGQVYNTRVDLQLQSVHANLTRSAHCRWFLLWLDSRFLHPCWDPRQS